MHSVLVVPVYYLCVHLLQLKSAEGQRVVKVQNKALKGNVIACSVLRNKRAFLLGSDTGTILLQV